MPENSTEYRKAFQHFAIHDCGFIARSAKEDEHSSTPRVEKIYQLIQESKYGIHDFSRVTLDASRLPRFNMPLELGIWLAPTTIASKITKKTIASGAPPCSIEYMLRMILRSS